jgi:hypothetical protein
MDKKYESGRTILKVIAFIVIIGLLLTLIVRICQKTGASAKADDIAKAVAERVEIYRPEIQKQRLDKMNYPSKAYYQNGPHGTTIIIQSETAVSEQMYKPGYFSIAVNIPKSKNICKKLIETDLITPKYITINGSENGECPGLIRFYFPVNSKIQHAEYDSEIILPKLQNNSQKNSYNQQQNVCPKNKPYHIKDNECVTCLSASHCDITEDCIDNKCYTCPAFSSRIVRLNQRIGTTNCYCNSGYQLNNFKNSCTPISSDWDIGQNCVGNICAFCPENANKTKGYRIDRTNCFCNEGFIAVKIGSTQWRCEKSAQNTNIVVHEGEYNIHDNVKVVQKEYQEQPKKEKLPIKKRPAKIQPKYHQTPVKSKPEYIPQPMNFDIFEPIPLMIPQEILLPILPEYANGNLNFTQWEEVEVRFH